MRVPYAFEFEEGTVREWHLTSEGARFELVSDYRPSLFVDGPADALVDLRDRLAADPKVAETGFAERYTTLHDTKSSEVLRASLDRVDEIRTLAREIRGVHGRDGYAPGTFRLFDVDFTPGFRYCLDRGIDPTPSPPDRDLRTLSIGIDERSLAEGDVSRLRLDGEAVEGEPADVLWSLHRRLEREDPDALVLSHGDLVPLLERTASEEGLAAFSLGRLPGWTKLAGQSTYESYGQVGHSPARYRVPGRPIVDRSNSFLHHQSGLAGLSSLIGRSRKPLQEAAWASIGTILTAIEIRVARDWGVLAPLNKWEPEAFKDARTLHAADRGGFTFAPDVGFHEDVHEIDFASLYPRIICRYNVSPETIDCACCAGDGSDGEGGDGGGAIGAERRAIGAGDAGGSIGAGDAGESIGVVPELGYRVCEERGFLPAVLKPLLDERAAVKRRLAEDPPEPEAAELRARSGAIKWVLVSCFGYQGYRNAKFGRIECHEAINAYARQILLESKDRLEEAGWRIVHGIVDSLWVTPRVDEPDPLSAVIAEISRAVGIPLERDGAYEWVCFVPRRDAVRRSAASGSRGNGAAGTASGGPSRSGSPGSVAAAPAGALTRYFGKRTDGEYTFRGIELRQRNTPPFVADCQRALVEALDETRDPEAVCDLLGRRLAELRRGAIDPADLVITARASKPIEAYRQETRTVGALRRYDAHGIDRHPGQSVRYVVVDDDARRTRDRVRLDFEFDDARDDGSDRGGGSCAYDPEFYADLLVRACESVVSPLGWDRGRIRRYLADGRTVRLSAFGAGSTDRADRRR